LSGGLNKGCTCSCWGEKWYECVWCPDFDQCKQEHYDETRSLSVESNKWHPCEHPEDIAHEKARMGYVGFTDPVGYRLGLSANEMTERCIGASLNFFPFYVLIEAWKWDIWIGWLPVWDS
jgi:hypothetical protein